jgi:hypothetical protein
MATARRTAPAIGDGMAKVTVTDPNGAQWTVRRWWWSAVPSETGLAALDAIIFVIVLPFMIAWPFWLLSKWLGARWSIVIERDGVKLGEEKVRGWGRSGSRIDEIAQSAAAGTLTQYADKAAAD